MPDMNLVTLISLAIAGALVLLILLAVFSLLRAFLRGIRHGKRQPYVAPMDPNPPAPVETTGALRTVAWASLGWGAFNAALVLVWLARGSKLIDPPVQWLLSIYVLTSAVAIIAGAFMLLAGRRYGRRGVAWGCMLLGVMSFSGCVMFVIIKYDPESQQLFRDVAIQAAVFLGLHVVADILLGALAQRVGLGPREREEEFELPIMPPMGKAPYE
jgi:hypothetical protein